MKTQNKVLTITRKRIEDNRGYFLKVIDGNEPFNPFDMEVYITSAKPDESKGGHYHLKANEWFTLIKGEALLIIIDVNTKEKTEIRLCDFEPKTIYVPFGYAHRFENVGSEDYILLAYTDAKYDPSDTIIYNF